MLLDTGATAKPSAAGEHATGTPTVHGYGVTSYAPRSLIDRWHVRHPDWPLVEDGDALIPHMRVIRVPEVQIANWSLGPIWFTERADRNIEGLGKYMSGPVQGSAGANIYQHFVMTVDYHDGKLYLACVTDCHPGLASGMTRQVKEMTPCWSLRSQIFHVAAPNTSASRRPGCAVAAQRKEKLMSVVKAFVRGGWHGSGDHVEPSVPPRIYRCLASSTLRGAANPP